METSAIHLSKLKAPPTALPDKRPLLSRACFENRLEKFRAMMDAFGVDCAVVYADREHYSNFKYLMGFDPRFEEAVLVVHKSGPVHVMLGNECYPLYKLAQIETVAVLEPSLSLPGQPMEGTKPLAQRFADAGVTKGSRVGVIGWKLFTPAHGEGYKKMHDLPTFIMDGLQKAAGTGDFVNCTPGMVDPAIGIRVRITAEEIAALEYGAAWAGDGTYQAIMNLKPGMNQEDVARYLTARGGQQSCHPLCLAAEDMHKGLISPTTYNIQKGDGMVVSMGLEGGLTCRKGYVANDENDLPADQKDYIEALAKPYFTACAAWYEAIGIGVSGGAIYDLVNGILPKAKFGWTLNPGHLVSTEEWMSSPVAPGSEVTFQSGNMIQMDIIPEMAPYGGVNMEDGIALADEALRADIAQNYPELWQRIQARRTYMKEELGINLKDEVLPLSNITGWYAPFYLQPDYGFKIDA